MTEERIKQLEAAGFQVGTVAEFLGLTPEEEAEIERRIEVESLHAAYRGLCKRLGPPSLKSDVQSVGIAENSRTLHVLLRREPRLWKVPETSSTAS